MPIAFRPGRSILHVLKGDRAEKDPARFLVRGLTGTEAQDFSDGFDKLKREAGEKKLTGREGITHVYEAIRTGGPDKSPILAGWENLRDASGVAVPFDLSKLESVLALGEANEIIKIAIQGMSEDDAVK